MVPGRRQSTVTLAKYSLLLHDADDLPGLDCNRPAVAQNTKSMYKDGVVGKL